MSGALMYLILCLWGCTHLTESRNSCNSWFVLNNSECESFMTWHLYANRKKYFLFVNKQVQQQMVRTHKCDECSSIFFLCSFIEDGSYQKNCENTKELKKVCIDMRKLRPEIGIESILSTLRMCTCWTNPFICNSYVACLLNSVLPLLSSLQ